jgi:hypothetical protein
MEEKFDYEADLRRQWEVNAYNNLGFICSGYYVEETNRGWKNESREATEIESRMWEKFCACTPAFPVFKVSDDIDISRYWDLDTDARIGLFTPLENIALDGKFAWIENALDIVLFEKQDLDVWSWYQIYGQIKEICVCTESFKCGRCKDKT